MKIAIFIFSLLIILSSCSKDDSLTFESIAKIKGADLSECACCGGWIIEIDGDTNSQRFEKLPKNSSIDLQNATFPIFVNLNWTKDESYCGKGIIVDAIELK